MGDGWRLSGDLTRSFFGEACLAIDAAAAAARVSSEGRAFVIVCQKFMDSSSAWQTFVRKVTAIKHQQLGWAETDFHHISGCGFCGHFYLAGFCNLGLN